MVNISVKNMFEYEVRRSIFSKLAAHESMTAAITPWIRFITGMRKTMNSDFDASSTV